MRWLAPMLVALALLVPRGAAAEEVRRFLVVVGYNGGGVGAPPALRFADDDAGRTFELLASDAAHAVLLTTFDAESQELFPHLVAESRQPTRRNLVRALDETYRAIDEARAAGARTVLHVFFSGHGSVQDGSGARAFLELADGAWTRDDMLDEIVRPQVADYTHLVVDSCNAFFMVHGRGWEDDAATDPAYGAAVDELLADAAAVRHYARVGLFLATTGAAEVHEWGRYQAGVFSHQFRSALVGAADVDGDGALTYDEIGAYIAAANAAVATPNARLSVYASAPEQNRRVPFLDAEAMPSAARLVVEPGASTHIRLTDERGSSYADVTTDGDRRVTVALVDGGRIDAAYMVSRGDEEAWVGWQPEASVDTEALEWSASAIASRSPIDREFHASLFSVPFSRAFYEGFVAGRRDVAASTARAPEPRRFSAGVALGAASPFHAGQAWETRIAGDLRIGRVRPVYGLVRLDGGFSGGDSDARVRRAAAVGGIGLELPISRVVRWGAELAAGPQWVAVVGRDVADATGVRSDRVGLRTELGTGLGFVLGGPAQLDVGVVGAMNVVSALHSDRNGAVVTDTDGEPLLTETARFQVSPMVTLRLR